MKFYNSVKFSPSQNCLPFIFRGLPSAEGHAVDVGEDHGAQPALPLRPYLRHGQQDQRHEPTAQQLPDDERFLAW